MIADKDICLVTNRSTGPVMYQIPDEKILRTFNTKETKKITFGELNKLAMQPGGRELLHNYLYVQKEAIEEIMNTSEQPEYYLKEEDIPSWIISCSLDEFKDALDFAPEGVKDLIKKYAVSNELNDMNKRQAILDQLGFNVTKAIEHQKESQEGEMIAEEPKRRVSASNVPERRTTPKYNIVNKK